MSGASSVAVGQDHSVRTMRAGERHVSHSTPFTMRRTPSWKL
jgi:hypothetical protein